MATTTVYDLSACPCCEHDGHIVSCNDVKPVPNVIHITITFNGHSVSIPLTWITPDSWAVGACGGNTGWAMESLDSVEICDGLWIYGQGVVLCCNGSTAGLGSWDLTVVLSNDGIHFATQLSTLTLGNHIVKPFTVISTNPIDQTTQTEFTFDSASIGGPGCGEDFFYFEITP